jgi:hypothetical protein
LPNKSSKLFHGISFSRQVLRSKIIFIIWGFSFWGNDQAQSGSVKEA